MQKCVFQVGEVRGLQQCIYEGKQLSELDLISLECQSVRVGKYRPKEVITFKQELDAHWESQQIQQPL